MIVHQPLAQDFTVIPNELLRDRTLSFDAKAVMAWLLSLPRDWTVRVEQVRKHWGCGLERMKKIMQELIAAGWVQRRPSRRLHDGTFAGGDYIVFNVRQPVQEALPLDTSEEAEPESGKRTAAARQAPRESAEPESGKRTPYKDLNPPNNPPYPPEGGAPSLESNPDQGGDRAIRSGSRDPGRLPRSAEGCRGAEPPAVPPEAAARFERLWAAYPESGRLPSRSPARRARAVAVFAALSAADQGAVIVAAGEEARIRGQLRTQARALHRWLEQGYWRSAGPTSGGAGSAGAPQQVFVHEDSPEWAAWAAHHRRQGRPMRAPTWSPANGANGWYFPTALPPAAAEAA